MQRNWRFINALSIEDYIEGNSRDIFLVNLTHLRPKNFAQHQMY